MHNSEQEEKLRIYSGIDEYCETYNIPKENLLDILEDQKVVPMIRGKATEYIGAAVLRRALNARDWSVQKLNLNPQPGVYDEDVSITHNRTGIRLKAETKNAVRGKFSMGTRNVSEPHFAVKCHKSRSHMGRATNDRYIVGDFDVLLTNVSNAIFQPKTLERGLPLIENREAIAWLKKFYGVSTDDELRRATYDDWRVCLPADIADEEDNTIPRTPRVLMSGGDSWFRLETLSQRLQKLINSR